MKTITLRYLAIDRGIAVNVMQAGVCDLWQGESAVGFLKVFFVDCI